MKKWRKWQSRNTDSCDDAIETKFKLFYKRNQMAFTLQQWELIVWYGIWLHLALLSTTTPTDGRVQDDYGVNVCRKHGAKTQRGSKESWCSKLQATCGTISSSAYQLISANVGRPIPISVKFITNFLQYCCLSTASTPATLSWAYANNKLIESSMCMLMPCHISTFSTLVEPLILHLYGHNKVSELFWATA